MPSDKARVLAYVEPAYRKSVEALASAQNRSISNYVETLIMQAVSDAIANGELPAEDQGGSHD